MLTLKEPKVGRTLERSLLHSLLRGGEQTRFLKPAARQFLFRLGSGFLFTLLLSTLGFSQFVQPKIGHGRLRVHQIEYPTGGCTAPLYAPILCRMPCNAVL